MAEDGDESEKDEVSNGRKGRKASKLDVGLYDRLIGLLVLECAILQAHRRVVDEQRRARVDWTRRKPRVGVVRRWDCFEGVYGTLARRCAGGIEQQGVL